MHGFIFEVEKKEGDAAFRRSDRHFKTITTKGRVITFTFPELVNLVKELEEKQDDYKQIQDELVQRVLMIVSSYYPVMEKVSGLIAELDVLVSFAVSSTLSSTSVYVKPIFAEDDGQIIIKKCRHPLIELMDPLTCIANSCEMIKGKSNLHIITGPNMGGKSTFIRQIGINVLMAHIGCFVPAEYAEIPIIDAIIARVGASDH